MSTIHSSEDPPLTIDNLDFELTFENLTAEVEVQDAPLPGVLGGPGDFIDEAAGSAEIEVVGTVAITDQRPGEEAEKRVNLAAPVYDPEGGMALIYFDENGQASIHLPEYTAGADVLGPLDRAVFNVPLRPQIERDDGPQVLAGGAWLLKGFLKVIGWKGVGAAAKKYGPAALRTLENEILPTRVLDRENVFAEKPVDLDGKVPPAQRALLFIHGTISRANKAFKGLDGNAAFLAEIDARYGSAVYAYDHPTIATGIATNIMQFYDRLAPGEHNFDVICHSRGGLVARALRDLDEAALKAQFKLDAERGQYSDELTDWGNRWSVPAGVSIRVDRIVFAGVPHAGTVLAKPGHLKRYLEILITLAAWAPEVIDVVLEGVLSVIKVLAGDVLPVLPGLNDFSPDSELLERLSPAPGEWDAALRANFEPPGVLGRIADSLWDHLFSGADNDVLVTLKSAGEWREGTFPNERLLTFKQDHESPVWHSTLFAQPETPDKILSWLAA
ncbi:MAG TPA: hypothetical protein VMN57_13130 [Anaerolineales bacterium]|nr:hypothetical protein [Anaerolineales bacterium]